MSLNEENLKEEDTERRNDESGPDYLLAVGEAAARRLLMLDEIFGPHSRELLGRAGLTQGMRVADIGCGTGLVSLWIAAQFGAGGSVMGVDMSGEQLRIAEKNAVAAELTNVSFYVANLVIVIVTLAGAVRQLFLFRSIFWQIALIRRDVVEQPVRKLKSKRRVLVEHNQYEALGMLGRSTPR